MNSTTIAPEALASVLRLSVMRLARRLRAERAPTDVSLSQISALATLYRHGPQTPGELAAHERVQPPSMTRLLTRLEEVGLVTRAPHQTDRRQVLITLAPEGHALLEDSRARKDAWLAQRLAALPAADRETLRKAADVLDRLVAE
jgi:DNA-binding MarR family transcriptional regulator